MAGTKPASAALRLALIQGTRSATQSSAAGRIFARRRASIACSGNSKACGKIQFLDARELTRLGLEIFQEFVDERGRSSGRFQAGGPTRLSSASILSQANQASRQAHRKAVDLFEQLLAEYPERRNTVWFWAAFARHSNWDILGPSRSGEGRIQERSRPAQIIPFDHDGWIHNNLAFILWTAWRGIHDPSRLSRWLSRRGAGPREPGSGPLGFARISREWRAGIGDQQVAGIERSGAKAGSLAMIAWHLR